MKFRQLLTLGPYGYLTLELRARGDSNRPIHLDVSSLHLELSEGDAGLLLDALAEALRTLTGDTPSGNTEAVRAPR